jgi:hypothetical protein
MSKRLTLAEMQEIARGRGGECLSSEYKNAASKLLWRCAEGHRWQAKGYSVKSGRWCKICAGKAPGTLEEMRKIALERGGECLSTEYKNNCTPLAWRCAEGHRWAAPGHNVKNGSWCKICAGFAPLTLAEMHEIAKYRGGECLSSEYKNAASKLLWRCAEGHCWAAPGARIKSGHWCPHCQNKGERRATDLIEKTLGTMLSRGSPGWCRPKTGRGSRKGIIPDGTHDCLGFVFERHGEQHYKPVPHFHGREDKGEAGFERQIARDAALRSLCVEHKMFLFELPFTDGDPATDEEKPLPASRVAAQIDALARDACLPFTINPEYRRFLFDVPEALATHNAWMVEIGVGRFGVSAFGEIVRTEIAKNAASEFDALMGLAD